MDSLVTVSAVELERLLITIESSQQVHQRHQYFLWSQGVLQSFLPHEALIVGHGDYDNASFRYEVLGRLQVVGDPALSSEFDKLVGLAVDGWLQGGRLPRSFSSHANGNGVAPVAQVLRRLSINHILAHGTREFGGDAAGFFIFLNMPEAPGRRQAYFAEMLMPYLHTTLYRVLTSDRVEPQPQVNLNIRLSGREAQVIALVRDGKTNQQIADNLALSPLTVKNHVQNILRKLEVSNRAQAVAKAVKAKLIADQPGA